MPGDGLPLPILIRGQVQLVGLLQVAAQPGELLLLVAVHHVERREAVVDVDAQLGPRSAPLALGHIGGPLREVADVADRGLHDESVAQVAGDGLGLGRRLDDDEGPGHASGS